MELISNVVRPLLLATLLSGASTVVVVNVASQTAGSLVARIQTDGNPNGTTLSADGSTLYVAQDNQDQVAVIDTATNKITHKIDTRGPAYLDFPANTTGAAPTAVAINRAKKLLYAVNAGSNSIAVIPLSGRHAFRTIAFFPPHTTRPMSHSAPMVAGCTSSTVRATQARTPAMGSATLPQSSTSRRRAGPSRAAMRQSRLGSWRTTSINFSWSKHRLSALRFLMVRISGI